ncbi:MAG TPA: lantibiotic dehydratase [Polyangiaceae bacterium]|nr:lantibiotic dehydratase [Polyangiaceae bacterium]
MSSYRTHTRPDSAVLESLRLQLEREPTLKSALRWRPNPSLYRVGDELRYIEARALPGGLRDNAAVSVASTSALLAALEAAHGPHGATRDELARSICQSEPDIAFVDAGAFVDALVEQQLLWSELAPSATGAPAMAALSRKLAKLPQGAAIAAALNKLDNGCQELDALPLGQGASLVPRCDPRWRRTLGIEDLWLRSKRVTSSLLRKAHVLPRLACAHAVSPFDLPSYRFLEAFASQG